MAKELDLSMPMEEENNEIDLFEGMEDEESAEEPSALADVSDEELIEELKKRDLLEDDELSEEEEPSEEEPSDEDEESIELGL